MTTTQGQEAALRFQLNALRRQRRNPILRYIWPSLSPRTLLIQLTALIAFLMAPTLATQLVWPIWLVCAATFVFVWYKSSFRTQRDERAEFVARAEKLGVGDIDATEFYERHTDGKVLM